MDTVNKKIFINSKTSKTEIHGSNEKKIQFSLKCSLQSGTRVPRAYINFKMT